MNVTIIMLIWEVTKISDEISDPIKYEKGSLERNQMKRGEKGRILYTFNFLFLNIN